MASSTENVKLGVCTVNYGGHLNLSTGTFTASGDPATYDQVDLGYTKGGVSVEVTTDTHPVTVDQFGESEIAERITKRSVKVTVPLAETTLENLIATMPGATLETDGVDSNKKRVVVDSAISTNLLTLARPLILHPKNNDAGNKLEDFTVLKAATAGAINFAFKHDEERIFNVTFTGYPDNDNSDLVFVVGDYTVTV